jgi:hypothetical protein
VKPCHHFLPEITQVGVRERWFNLCIQQLRAAGLPMEEVYVQIWVYRTDDDYRPQLEGVRAAGVGNVFCFYYCGWIPPEPPEIVNPNDLAFRVSGPDGQPWPEATHEAHPSFLEVGEGRAQSFIAAGDRVAKVALYLAPAEGMPAHTVTLEGHGSGIPDGKPLATAELTADVVKAEGWVEIDLAAEVQPGKTYWITLRPKDAGRSPLRVGATEDDSFPGGQSVFHETHGTYFRNWRTYDLAQMGIGDWPASYQQRLAVERLLER